MDLGADTAGGVVDLHLAVQGQLESLAADHHGHDLISALA